MKLGYKRLRDYIQLVDERNRNLEVTNLLGISVTKNFIPSVANIVGTDMANYKVVRKNQFACSIMQVRRDKKMPVALYLENEPSLISQAYPVFKIIDETFLLPEYLMMWFTRSEFDREACFLAVGGVRGSLEWEDFLNMELPIPSLEKQKEIVAEYEAIENRIQLNKKLCATLEEAAQTIYKHWFEDFEFPVSRHCEEEGTTDSLSRNNGKAIPSIGYKSSGGEMVECQELGKEIPKGWRVGKLGEIAKVKSGFAFKSADWKKAGLPVIKIGSIFANSIDIYNLDFVNINAHLRKEYIAKADDIVIAMTGATIGKIGIIPNFFTEYYINQRVGLFEFKNNLLKYFLYLILQKDFIQNDIKNVGGDSAQANISNKQIENFEILLPENSTLMEFCENIKIIVDKIQANKSQNQKLEELKNLLLGKMAVEV